MRKLGACYACYAFILLRRTEKTQPQTAVLQLEACQYIEKKYGVRGPRKIYNKQWYNIINWWSDGGSCIDERGSKQEKWKLPLKVKVLGQEGCGLGRTVGGVTLTITPSLSCPHSSKKIHILLIKWIQQSAMGWDEK